MSALSLRTTRLTGVFAVFYLALCVACASRFRDDPSLIDVSQQTASYSGPQTAIFGRVGTDASNNTVVSWPGTELTTRFSGTEVTAQMKLKEAQPQNFYQVEIDGAVTEIRAIDANTTTYTFKASGQGPHTLRLTKMNEGMDGLMLFGGFQAAEGEQLLPTQVPTGRRIEFIGDSITCGYGNLGNITTQLLTASQDTTQNALRDCNHFLGKEVYQVSNGALAFGPQAAKMLSAESRQICWSGKGIYRNADQSTQDLMPEVWSRSITTDGNSRYDTAQWVPQAVVIDLGTNDFGSVAQADAGGPPNQTVFKQRYTNLVRQVRKAYPDAWILLAVGPMLSDYYPKTYKALTTMREDINSILGTLGDSRIKYFEFPLNISSDLDGTGCEWHPDVSQDTAMAQKLVAALQTYLGWKS